MDPEKIERAIFAIAGASISLVPVHVALAIANVKPWAKYAGIASISILVGGTLLVYLLDKRLHAIRHRLVFCRS